MLNEQFTKISFYVVAHADDWQLFMNPNVFKDIVAPECKVIIIITTAGDAGFDEKFWSAREEGSKSSIRFCLAPLAPLLESGGIRELNSHTVNYWSVNNVTIYFLRLPDGNLDGNGNAIHGFQSLPRLKAGQISAITTVDNSTRYQSWADFHSTLQTIILFEGAGISNRCINYLNPDTGKNPNDHPDHIITGQAIQAMGVIRGIPQVLFVGYNMCNGSENLDQTDLFWKAGMFAAYEKAVFDGSGYSTLHEGIQAYHGWCLSSANFITTHP